MPTSDVPSARGFHAAWLSGFKIVIHGGQGTGGIGKASVLSDTWQFDLYTLDWSRFSFTSDAVPVASNFAVAPVMELNAIAFGGMAQDGAARLCMRYCIFVFCVAVCVCCRTCIWCIHIAHVVACTVTMPRKLLCRET
jgi:hypothetical protein